MERQKTLLGNTARCFELGEKCDFERVRKDKYTIVSKCTKCGFEKTD